MASQVSQNSTVYKRSFTSRSSRSSNLMQALSDFVSNEDLPEQSKSLIQDPSIRSSFRNKGKKLDISYFWRNYLESRIVKTGCVQEAVIATLDGTIIANVGLDDLTREDVMKIVGCLDRPQDTFLDGIQILGRKYMYLSGSSKNVRGTTVEGDVGLIACRSRKFLLVGVSDDVETLGECDFVVDKQTGYLEFIGF